MRFIFTGSASLRVCHSCLPLRAQPGSVIWTSLVRFTPWDPPGSCFAWGLAVKFLLLALGQVEFLQGVPASGLGALASPTSMQLGTFVLPFWVQTSSLGPSGVAFWLGVGGKFLPSWRFIFTGSAILRVCHSCLPLRAQPGSVIWTSLVRFTPWDPPGSCFAWGLAVKFLLLGAWSGWFFTGSSGLRVRRSRLPH